MGPLRILIFAWRDLAHPAAGGAEVYNEAVTRRWVRAGHRVTLFCAAITGEPGREYVQGVEIVRRGSRFSVYREARKFWAREGSNRYDVVVDCINTRPFDTPRFVIGTPIVAVAHQVAREVWWYEAPLPMALLGRFVFEPLWLRRYRDVPTVTISKSSRDSFERYGLRRLTIVPGGIDDVSIGQLPAKRAVPTLVFCGRLVRSKRPHHAIAAFEVVRRHVPSARLIVIGTGPLERRLRRCAPAGVELVGKVTPTDKRALLASAHALVITSVREGWGLVVSEAAALGTPTLGYDVPGLRDSIVAAHGRLCAPDTTALASALCDSLQGGWLDDPPAPLPWGGAISWDDVATQLLHVVYEAARPTTSRPNTPVST